jgi:hypothetical protein
MAINSYLARVGTTDKIEPVAELEALAATFASTTTPGRRS